MQIEAVIIIVIVAVIIALIFSFVKNAFKALMLSFLIISLVLGLATFFVFKDAMELKEKFLTEDKLMVLKNSENVYTAVSFVDISSMNSLNIISKSEIETIKQSIETEDFSQLTAKYYKVMIFNLSAFDDSLKDGVVYRGDMEMNITKEQIFDMLNSDSPLDFLLDEMPKKLDGMPIPENLEDVAKERAKEQMMQELNLNSENDMKGFLFMMIFMDMMMDEGPEALIKKIRTKDIQIYPNTALFKAIGFIPNRIIEKASDIVPSIEEE
ncbi:hypothetical protein GOV08_04555 [Candidatus Woesearchaeota archaeon]|nr:hypothetical protein [Candidatus Woesearchaeota archaeon]